MSDQTISAVLCGLGWGAGLCLIIGSIVSGDPYLGVVGVLSIIAAVLIEIKMNLERISERKP